MKKPELLLPVGNTEAFYAAAEAGADAVYLGLRNFNARGRAKNFAPNQLQSILKEAKQKKLNVYLTLNTLIKNSELPDLLDTLYLISQTSISAVIIQDLGVYYLLSKFFPNIPIHASTQMGFHNSAGADFAHNHKFERIILARELTWSELKRISNKSKIELEIFAHGALCYSFSGSCLFSSYLGGMSANRGLCRQPCRRAFDTGTRSDYIFSLKDNQLLKQLPEIMKLNVSSIKIEGRMKSAEYVYQVAKAYRLAIDHPDRIEEAEKLLNFDMGRQKTSYFMGGSVSDAITHNPFTGISIGQVEDVDNNSITITSSLELTARNRIRVQPANGTDSKAIKLKNENLVQDKNDKQKFHISIENPGFSVGDKVFLIGLGEQRFKNKFALEGKKLHCSKFFRAGVSHFMLANISQKNLFPNDHRIALSSNENIYCLNDAAIQFLKEEHFKFHIYPLENDLPNLLSCKDRKGIVPLYFYPELFYSRMPVNLETNSTFSDDTNKYNREIRDGITIVTPQIPVSLLQFKEKLGKHGFRRFLLDLSYQKPSQNTFNRLLKKFHTSQAEQPGTSFNFKLGLH
ncbi:MAG: hypothetical protein B1H06_01695 [Candidatus Cloacimonas sp. 4484_143]|nr:MAG: hypothetical protein B1H06_01695 [Candidatus Cloacimonas sp. 4484_143]